MPLFTDQFLSETDRKAIHDFALAANRVAHRRGEIFARGGVWITP